MTVFIPFRIRGCLAGGRLNMNIFFFWEEIQVLYCFNVAVLLPSLVTDCSNNFSFVTFMNSDLGPDNVNY